MVGFSFGAFASVKNTPVVHQWDGHGEVHGAGDAVVTTNGTAVTKWLPNTTGSGIWFNPTPTGYLQLGPPRGLHAPILTLQDPTPTPLGNCVFVVVRMNAPSPVSELTTILHLCNENIQFNWNGASQNCYYYYNTTGASMVSPTCSIGQIFVVGMQIKSMQTNLVWDPSNTNNVQTVTHPQSLTQSTGVWVMGHSSTIDYTLFEVAVYGDMPLSHFCSVYRALRAKWNAP